MKKFEIITKDENGCVWNWEEEEDNVVIEAAAPGEAFSIFFEHVDSEYEEEAKKYYAREITDFNSYAENHYYTMW